MLTTVRVQEKGQVTIPRDLRRKLRLKKGDMVTFTETPQGVMLRSLGQAVQELRQTLEASLAQRGKRLDDLLSASQEQDGEQAVRAFGLDETERALFYQFAQLRAQMALEAIRSAAEVNGAAQLSDEEIEAEIQAARREG
jgi:AbrB family looped-hinge helix DNA binding protein